MGGPSKTLLRPSDAQEQKKHKKVIKMTPKICWKTAKKGFQTCTPKKLQTSAKNDPQKWTQNCTKSGPKMGPEKGDHKKGGSREAKRGPRESKRERLKQ